jgi:hypothetical protein
MRDRYSLHPSGYFAARGKGELSKVSVARGRENDLCLER